MNQVGLAARAFARHIEELRQQGSLLDGVQLPDGGSLRIDITGELELPGAKLASGYADNIILCATLNTMNTRSLPKICRKWN